MIALPMDIHPPDRPILSFKEFLVHIGTVTIGILIALSLEQLIEWRHHQNLIGEARDNIRAEIADNRRELAGHIAETPKNIAGQEAVLQWIADIEKRGTSSIHSLKLETNLAELSSTSWTTAQAVGALALMDYAEVKRDAAVYQLQQEFEHLQREALDATTAAMAPFTGRTVDPAKASAAELQEERNRVRRSLAALQVQDQIGKALEKRYDAWLKGR